MKIDFFTIFNIHNYNISATLNNKNVVYHHNNMYDRFDMNLLKFVGEIVIWGHFFPFCVIFLSGEINSTQVD